jgi:hypothetical protein
MYSDSTDTETIRFYRYTVVCRPNLAKLRFPAKFSIFVINPYPVFGSSSHACFFVKKKTVIWLNFEIRILSGPDKSGLICVRFVHCTLYTAHCTLYTVHCTLYTAHCILHTAHCTLYTVLIVYKLKTVFDIYIYIYTYIYIYNYGSKKID